MTMWVLIEQFVVVGLKMPLLPINTVRTSTPLSSQRSLFQLNADQVALQRNFDQLSTGRRVLRLSDDPAAAGRAITLQQGIDRGNQLIRNANSTSAFYQTTDAALARITDALTQARGVTVEAAQNVISEDERIALAATIRQTLESTLSAGNTMFNNHQMLGGILDSGDAYDSQYEGVLFGGNQAIGLAELGSGKATEINVTGNDALGAFSVIVHGEPLAAALDENTRLVDMRSGAGVKPGVIRISDGSSWQQIDLSAAASIGDIQDVLEAYDLNGRSLTVSIQPDSIQIEYTDGLPGTLAIDNASGATIASDLGIRNALGLNPPPLVGDQLAPRATVNTKISDLAAGAGVDLSDGLRITQGERVFTVDLSGAQTIGDVLIAINRSGADVRAKLSESDGRIDIHALRSGVDYSIGENGGTAAQQLGIRSATGDVLLSDLDRGRGPGDNPYDDDLVITRPDGVELRIELGNAETVGEVMDLIRNHPLNQDSSKVLVELNSVGNGLKLTAPPGANSLRVSQPNSSNLGYALGLIPAGASESVGQLDGSFVSLTGRDFLPREAGDTFDTLLRLETAVRENDISEITRLQARLDVDLARASRTRGRVGIMAQHADTLKTAVEDNVVVMESQKSTEIDADLATVISELTQRQTSIEASMRLIGQISQLTVLNFL